MTEVQRLAKIKVLKDMLKEYELLAKYNGGTDYDRWNALDMAINALSAIEDIKADIEKYEADCILSDDSKECKECDKIVFGSIYNIINKHIGKENE